MLIPISVDVDLIRFEKNLLQIGFFGATDGRNSHQTLRRVEQEVVRNGHKEKVAAEFRGSAEYGLPSTADRDKFIAFLKILSEDRAKRGKISNPVCFSGYRMIKELGLSRNGDIYEDILRWGKRMADTTITSERVVFLASKKLYTDDVLHVFNRFRRSGKSNLQDGERYENYEVELSDWMIENLNHRYVVPEDFNAYKKLTRPTAKGIFGYLHLWFHASLGRPVEKDYVDLCNELGIQSYRHLSKIRSTMGLALDELTKIKYLSKWDIQPMVTKNGYKLIFAAGSELSNVLRDSRGERKLLPEIASEDPITIEAQQGAVKALLDHGVLPNKAKQLVLAYGSETVVDMVDYVESQIHTKRNRVANPAGLIIYSLENNLPIPIGFVTSRRRQEMENHSKAEEQRRQQMATLEFGYMQWKEEAIEEAITSRYSATELQAKLNEIVSLRTRTDEMFKKIGSEQRKTYARQFLRKEVRDSLILPTFEEWASGRTQFALF